MTAVRMMMMMMMKMMFWFVTPCRLVSENMMSASSGLQPGRYRHYNSPKRWCVYLRVYKFTRRYNPEEQKHVVSNTHLKSTVASHSTVTTPRGVTGVTRQHVPVPRS
jgi:hypothetical protein